MPSVNPKSFLAKPGQVPRQWFLVDATDQVLGRLASQVAVVLMGKNKPQYTPHVDTGDFVIITNASKVKVTGRKVDQVEYDRYTYHAGGRKVISMKDLLAQHPDRVIKLAVRRMLPKSAMGRRLLTKLKVYRDDKHRHQAQSPQPMKLKSR